MAIKSWTCNNYFKFLDFGRLSMPARSPLRRGHHGYPVNMYRADSADAEFAIAVADEWQGAGLGRELLVRLSAHAREHGVRRLFGDVLWGNNAMLGLARELGAVLKRRPGDATVVQVEFGFDTANESTPGASDTLCTNALSSAPAMHS